MVQHFKKRGLRIEYDGFQAAGIADHALIRGRVETFEQVQIGFGRSHQFTDQDFFKAILDYQMRNRRFGEVPVT